MSLPSKHKKINIKLLHSGKKHSIEVFENLQHSKIFINLKKKYLKEWLIKIRSEGELPEHVIIPKDDKIINYWNGLLKEKAGLSKAIKIGQSSEQI